MIIVQARMGSSRLPGKVLALIGKKPLLSHLTEALHSRFSSHEIIIATSREPASDPIAEHCRKHGIGVFRGDERDVASRFREIVAERMPERFCRVSGDSPFLDVETVVRAFEAAEKTGADLVSTAGSAFPSGMNVEVLKTAVFLEAYPAFARESHFEHVTRYFYENPGKFKIHYLECPVSAGRACKFSVDTPEDQERMTRLASQFERPHYAYSLSEKCAMYGKLFGAGGC